MKSFIVLAILMSAGAMAERSVVIDGAVIDVPEWAQVCEHDPLYCPGGWKPDGTFPLAPLRAAVLEAWEQCSPSAIIICEDELAVGPAQCTQDGVPVDVVKCDDGELVIGPATCP